MDTLPVEQGPAWRKGNELVVTVFSKLPDFCVRCGQVPAGEPVRKKYTWHHPMLYFMVIFPGLLIYLIVALIVSKKMTVNIPLCEEHRSRYQTGRRIGGFLMLAAIPAGITVGFVLPDGAGWGVLLGFGMLVAGAIVFSVADGLLRPSKIDEKFGYFRGANEAFLSHLPAAETAQVTTSP